MRQFRHSVHTRSMPVRGAHSAHRWQAAAHAALVTAAFLFVGAVTLGLFP